MRCRNCGKEMTQTGASSKKISDNLFQTKRYYKCTKCGKTYTETLEPMEV